MERHLWERILPSHYLLVGKFFLTLNLNFLEIKSYSAIWSIISSLRPQGRRKQIVTFHFAVGFHIFQTCFDGQPSLLLSPHADLFRQSL